MENITHSTEETKRLAFEIAKKIQKGRTLACMEIWAVGKLLLQGILWKVWV